MHIERKVLLWIAPIRLRIGKYSWQFKTWCHAMYCRAVYTPVTAKIKIEARRRQVQHRNNTEISSGSTPIGLMVTRLNSIAEHYKREPQSLHIWKPVERTLTGGGTSKDIEFTCMLMMLNTPNDYQELFRTFGDLTNSMEQFYGEYPSDNYPCWHRKTIAVGTNIEVVDIND